MGAAIEGDAVLINNLLQELSSSERDSILKPTEVNSSDDITFHMFEEATGYGNRLKCDELFGGERSGCYRSFEGLPAHAIDECQRI